MKRKSVKMIRTDVYAVIYAAQSIVYINTNFIGTMQLILFR
ncbi:hypothetical protein EV209_1372 [Cuneatibacter caecimuris]|uniref:Uncharacterized protein n=1 Tax=Cuneatibacter caecimuris TaxID=1796618 RepID=A0A4Q7PJU5_9FIRM|nr:hypothetical protein EV209_1372 [Cuneatibacter caecimuris]